VSIGRLFHHHRWGPIRSGNQGSSVSLVVEMLQCPGFVCPVSSENLLAVSSGGLLSFPQPYSGGTIRNGGTADSHLNALGHSCGQTPAFSLCRLVLVWDNDLSCPRNHSHRGFCHGRSFPLSAVHRPCGDAGLGGAPNPQKMPSPKSFSPLLLLSSC